MTLQLHAPIGLPSGQRLDDLVHPELEEKEYKHRLKDAQRELLHIQQQLQRAARSMLIVFEGPDAAGKSGAIKRITEKLDPRLVRVHSIVKPTEEELAHHYLWRFWNKLPPRGHTAIFDRSWYGRVLVERVEHFATTEEWQRAFGEINEFERQLHDDGTIMVKIHLHISKEEQLARFELRQADPWKSWKITDEDWRNRNKWDEHNAAAEEMFARTSTAAAPWQIVAGDKKWYARVACIEAVVAALRQANFADLS